MTLRLIPEASNVRNGPEMATTKENILTSNPACEVEILNFSVICGSTPIIPISVVIMPNTPKARIMISNGLIFSF